MQAFFGNKHRFPGIHNLIHIARVRVTTDVRPGGNLKKELIYENHPSAQTFHAAMWEKAVAGVASGRAIVFPKGQAGQVPRLRVSAAGVVEERKNIKIVQDMTFEHRDRTGGRSVNSTTDWNEIPTCVLAGVMHEKWYRGFSG